MRVKSYSNWMGGTWGTLTISQYGKAFPPNNEFAYIATEQNKIGDRPLNFMDRIAENIFKMRRSSSSHKMHNLLTHEMNGFFKNKAKERMNGRKMDESNVCVRLSWDVRTDFKNRKSRTHRFQAIDSNKAKINKQSLASIHCVRCTGA